MGLIFFVPAVPRQCPRGREKGAVSKVIKDQLLRCGAEEDQIRHFIEESESLDAALKWAKAGDLIIMLALGGSKPIIEKLAALAES